jgi:hypothetical protein
VLGELPLGRIQFEWTEANDLRAFRRPFHATHLLIDAAQYSTTHVMDPPKPFRRQDLSGQIDFIRMSLEVPSAIAYSETATGSSRSDGGRRT